MKIKFERPITPNFVRTNKGTFAIKELSKEELEEYIDITCYSLREKWNIKNRTD